MKIRLTQAADVAIVHVLLTELAAFEGGAVQATMDDLARDGFGPHPLFEALLAEDGGHAMGLLVFFPIYSSWRGRPGVMIHDLFVRERARGQGLGKALVRELAHLTVARGGTRMDVNVLDWNAKARTFYEALGLRENRGWLGYRLEGEALGKLGEP